MRKLSLSELANVAEAIAAAGMIVSLVYLAVQIHQNTKAVRASSYQEAANGVTAFQTTLAQSEELARIYLQGSADLNELAPEELLRFESALGQLFVKYDVAVYYYREELIDETAIEPYTQFVLLLLRSPGIADWWTGAQHFYSSPMREYINTQMGG
jgi:hypothetical protein